MAAKDDYETSLSEAATALGSSDYATARRKVDVAAIHLARMAKSATGPGGTSFTKQGIKDLQDLREMINAAEIRDQGKFEVHSQWVP